MVIWHVYMIPVDRDIPSTSDIRFVYNVLIFLISVNMENYCACNWDRGKSNRDPRKVESIVWSSGRELEASKYGEKCQFVF